MPAQNNNPDGLFPELSPLGHESEATRARERSCLPAALQAAGADDVGRHYSLSGLKSLASERAACPGEWDMPAHLAGCQLCLGIYEALLQNEPPASAKLLDRCDSLFVSGAPPAKSNPRIVVYGRIMKWAATFLALASAAAFLRWYSPAAPVLVQGSALPRGEVASTAPGGSIANDKTFFAANAARIKMSDGSTVDLKDNSGFAYAKSGLGSEVITLSSGSASFVIKPRKPAQSFKVKTPIAEMTVIGTRFTVTEVMDSISVYESSPESAGRTYAEQVARVIVKVEEGTVGVSNGKLAIRVPAGQTAVVRRDQPLIQVLSNDGHM